MGVPREEWPTPEGGRPPDWPEAMWDAFVIMRTEGTAQNETAARVGRSAGTLSNYIRKCRIRYGPEFWPPSNPPGWPNGKVGNAVRMSREAWPELRAISSRNFGEGAEKALEVCVAALDSLMKDPVRLGLLSPREILDLARAAEILAKRADILSGIVPLSPALPNPHGPVETSGYEVNLGPLGQATPDHHREVIEMAELVVRTYKEERSAKLAS